LKRDFHFTWDKMTNAPTCETRKHPVYTYKLFCEDGRCWDTRLERYCGSGSKSGRNTISVAVGGGKCKTKLLSRIMYEAWHGAIPEGHDVDHINGNNGDDRPCNLQALSRKVHQLKTANQPRAVASRAAVEHKMTATRGDEVRTFTSANHAARVLGFQPSVVLRASRRGTVYEGWSFTPKKSVHAVYDGEVWKDGIVSLRKKDGTIFSCEWTASSIGRVRTVQRGHVLHTFGTRKEGGYYSVGKTVAGVNHGFRVNRIIATLFKRNDIGEDAVVDHLDGDRSNNAASNLEWVTAQENVTRGVGVAIEGVNAAGDVVISARTVREASPIAGVSVRAIKWALHMAALGKIGKIAKSGGLTWRRRAQSMAC